MDLLNTDDHVQDPPKDYWEELTGPGKKFDRTKYADEKDLYQAIAKGKYEADVAVTQRNRENAQLRNDYLQLDAEYKAGPKIQEMLNQAISQRLANSDHNPNANAVNDKAELDLKQIESLFDSKYSQTRQAEREAENYRLVEEKLKERHGSNYASALKKQVEELGETPEFVNNLAKRNPKLFFKTFGLDRPAQGENFQAPPSTSQRPGDPFSPTGGPKKTWAYWQKLKKDNPREYLLPKTQEQMQKAAIELGDEFNDGNFSSFFR